MAELHFAKPCVFTDEGGVAHTYAVGRHRNVPAAHADHWWVKAHLAKDGDEAPVLEALPLQHEERIKAKAAVDAAEGRARGAEAEREAAVSRADAAEVALVAERDAHAETRRLLDEATAPDGSEGGEASGPYTIALGGQGKFKILKDGVMVEGGIPKAEAQAKAADLNAKARAEAQG